MIEDRFTALLAKKLAEEISADELAEFNRLIAGNASFRSEYESIKSYWSETDEPYENIVSIFEDIKQRAGIDETGKTIELNGSEKRRLWPQAIAAAAVILIFASMAFYFIRLKTGSGIENSLTLNVLKTNSGATTRIRLADGTLVTLNAVSILKYPKTFAGKTREVFLNGEAFFDVAKDHIHPFIVHTASSDIHVLGTAFNVKSYDNESRFEATLFRGSIQATIKNAAGKSVLLTPSDKLVIESSRYYLTKETHLDRDTTNIETAWMHDKIIFKNQPFGLLANSLSRKYGINIIFNNNSLKRVNLTGEFEKENIDQVLLSLKLVARFNYKISGDSIYIF